ncbi:MAG: hypothetical protein IT183_06480 [Acidobacteria bacterium]|nr:hypothetical protein [Acidobacteriota bacterium]
MNGNLLARIATLDLTMPVRDISLGGFAVEAPLRFAHGEVHELLLCRGADAPLRARARAAYCHAKRDRDHLFITGWETLGDPETARVMAGLVDRWLSEQDTSADQVAPGDSQPYHEGPPTTGSPRASAGLTRGA